MPRIYLASNLVFLRTMLGISVPQLAEQIGVSRQAVYYWQTGEREPTIRNLVQLGDILLVSLDELLRCDFTE